MRSVTLLKIPKKIEIKVSAMEQAGSGREIGDTGRGKGHCEGMGARILCD